MLEETNEECVGDILHSSSAAITSTSDSTLPSIPKDFDITKFVEVKIVDQEKHDGEYMMFLVETRVSSIGTNGIMERLLGKGPLLTAGRRYSDFDHLHSFLENKYPWHLIPPLPDKLSSYAPWKIANQKFDPEFLEMRRFGLDRFLQRLLMHPTLSREEAVIFFLREDDYWQDRIVLPLLSIKVEKMVNEYSANMRLRNCDPRITQLRKRGQALQSAIGGLMRALERSSAQLRKVQELHNHYGSALSEWCALEKGDESQRRFADHLQQAGHYLDTYSTFGTHYAGEEDELLSQLREYYGFSNALLSLVRRVQCAGLRLERTEDALAAKRRDLALGQEAAPSGLRALRSRFSSPAERERRLSNLRNEVARLETDIDHQQVELRNGVAEVCAEAARFEKQRASDMQQIMLSFCRLESARTARALKVWSSCAGHFHALTD